VVAAPRGVTLVDVVTPLRANAAGSSAVAVVLGAAVLLAGPAAAATRPAPATARAADVVGGPQLAAPGIVVHRLAGATRLPKIDADTWVLADLTTGDVLAAKGAHTRVLPASTLKTLTSVALMPKLDRTTVVTATQVDTHAVGSHVGLVAGGTYTVWDLWNGLLLPSANDAASALARTNGGFPATVADMQAMATHLQANDTTPKTPSGLDTPGQLSSAYDMALFARAAMQIPDFRTITMTKHYAFPGKPAAAGAKRATYQIYTENRLLRHNYPGIAGGKTGFTSLAHRTFWATATRGGHTLVVTLFQIHEPTETAARKLLDWGFANRAKVAPVGTLVAPLEAGAPGSSAQPTSSAVGGGGTTASGGTTAAASGGIPWKRVAAVVLVVAVAALGFLWWRRRNPADRSPQHGSHEPVPEPSTPTPMSPAPVTARPASGASVVVPSVVVSSTAPVVPVVPVVDDSGTAEPEAPPTPTPPPAARPATGGNVRIISPPGRPPTT